ncbi:MAG: hypothetical protein MMC33_005666 [Icmadophila ericetorum]|nr:hypothetical protein [Icmadophila ericetorum]
MVASVDALLLLQQLEELTENPPSHVMNNDKLRIKLRDAARNFSIAMETEGDTIHRITSLPLQPAMAKIGIDLNLFEILAASESPMSSATLAKQTGVDPILMKRMLRYYASFRMMLEEDEDKFTPSNVTKALVPDGSKAGVHYFFDSVQGTFTELPKYLKDSNYKNPSDATHTAWQLTHKTDLHPFVWLQQNPKNFVDCITWMTAQRAGLPIWLDVYPFEELTKGVTPETPLFIDVGGGVGHQCLALKERFPDVQGRVVLQDRPEVIEHSLPIEGVEKEPYDFWTPEPIKGARAYYMRNIMHDWPDEKCLLILGNLKSAMTDESVILIDEMILPEKGTHWRAAQLDITMMSCLAALERSKNQWHTLIEAAGLKIAKVYTYTEELQDSIIVVTK